MSVSWWFPSLARVHRIWTSILASLGCAAWPQSATAHVSEGGLILLLPTGFYTASGVAAVALTVVLVAFLPRDLALRVFTARALGSVRRLPLDIVTSLASLALLAFLVVVGLQGSRDPLANPLPLFIWTLWWIGFFPLQALFGDLWHWLNPWTGLYRLLGRDLDGPPLLRLPERIGCTPAIVAMVGFIAFALADLSPDDPSRLARFVIWYWVYTFAGMLFFGGEVWLSRAECFTVLLRLYAKLSPFRVQDGRLKLGLPGWRLVEERNFGISDGVFVLSVLAAGSFDGVNETFWWLEQIGINPLEFPGRSAVVVPTLVGLVGMVILLAIVFAAIVYIGLRLVGETHRLRIGFARLAVAVLPIALAYHFSHYVTVLLVNAQYALAAASDPWSTGADYLGLGTFYVTTGFFNTHDTVEMIWLSQALSIVLGHILAVLLGHAITLDLVGNERKANISQVPAALFMVFYTLFGLWLLASPKGL